MSADRSRVLKATLEVLQEYAGQLGVRQIWYRLISPPYQLLPQTQPSYKGFDRWMVQWREDGVVPANRIADRSTAPSGGEYGAFESPQAWLEHLLVMTDTEFYSRRRWADQTVVPIIYVEKDTLTSTIRAGLEGLGVVVFPTRGIASFTKLWKLAHGQGRDLHVLYLTDHDATGVFMDRDFRSRLSRYGGAEVPVTRVALTIGQVGAYGLPPNPAHPRDSRSPAYIRRFGNRAWELDALPPSALQQIVRDAVEQFIDRPAWEATAELERSERARLAPLLEPVRSELERLAGEEGSD